MPRTARLTEMKTVKTNKTNKKNKELLVPETTNLEPSVPETTVLEPSVQETTNLETNVLDVKVSDSESSEYLEEDGNEKKIKFNTNLIKKRNITYNKEEIIPRKPFIQHFKKEQKKGILQFNYREVIKEYDDKKLSECNTEELLKYLVSTTNDKGERYICNILKNVLTGLSGETTYPSITYVPQKKYEKSVKNFRTKSTKF